MHRYFTASFLLIFLINTSIRAQSGRDNELFRRADSLHAKILTIDTHTDTPMQFFSNKSIDLGKWNPNTRVDFVKMQEGGLDAVFFAVFLEQGSRDNAGNIIAKNKALAIFKSIGDHISKYADWVKLVTVPSDVYLAKRQGKKAVLLGIENGYCIGNNLSNIHKFKQLGVAYITLSHTKNNDICDSSNDKPEHNGLSEFGIKVVREMNRLGIIVDVSHTSDKTIYDVVRYSKAPIIASHSCTRALTNNRRNLTDAMIRLIAKNGGVIQVCMVPHFVKSPLSGKATVADFVDHIDHVVSVAGIDYVGIGSDFDGGAGITGCKNVAEIKNITVELLRRGYSPKDIEKIWSSNFLRVMAEVQNLAE
ncbi:MAG: dipeptidase [Prevotellaceae bacterium]|jgi:microsomal dipeptidase-like Zn-dependent dipeptidase|nr:dipeptidase [Prevotellaceae bacterium]